MMDGQGGAPVLCASRSATVARSYGGQIALGYRWQSRLRETVVAESPAHLLQGAEKHAAHDSEYSTAS